MNTHIEILDRLTSPDEWFEEDTPIYGHPKDPYKRIEILPSTRAVQVKVDGATVAESSCNQFLHETMLKTRYYMPKTAVSSFAQTVYAINLSGLSDRHAGNILLIVKQHRYARTKEWQIVSGDNHV